MSRIGKSRDKGEWWLPGAGGQGETGSDCPIGTGLLTEMTKIFGNWIVVMVALTLRMYYKTNELYTLK